LLHRLLPLPLALAPLALSACAARDPVAAAPPRALPPMAGGASCALRGRVQTRGGDHLFAAREGDAQVAVFTGYEVDLELSEVASGSELRNRGVVHAGGMALRGWIGADAVPLYAQRDAPVIEGHVWIERGEELRALAGQGGAVRVEAAF